MKDWQLSEAEVRALVSVFAPDWDVSVIERIRRADVDSIGRIDVRFWYQGEAYMLRGQLHLDGDWREMSLERWRLEKVLRAGAERPADGEAGRHAAAAPGSDGAG